MADEGTFLATDDPDTIILRLTRGRLVHDAPSFRSPREVRDRIFQRDDYTCQICSVRGGHLHVDHVIPWSQDESLRFEESNLRTLCRLCHFEVTFGKPAAEAGAWGLTSVQGG